MPERKTAAEAAVLRRIPHRRPSGPGGASSRRNYLTPCMRRWINGAIRNRKAPAPISTQKPKV